uniref:Uncharacterized protein n=1 Tax=Porcine lymphotropic herpesvirus 2 TaxID=91741 RepID=Q8B420_9GAMA|nr:unknown [Porcine lymphotropic herpesvirus 2]
MDVMRTSLTQTLRRSTKRFKSQNTETVWTFTVFNTYVKFINNKGFKLTSNDTHLPTCSCLTEILQDVIPGYFYSSELIKYKQTVLKFLIFGHSDNQVPTNLQFLTNSFSEINIEVSHPQYVNVVEGSMVFYIVPLDIVIPQGLNLKCLHDKSPCHMGTSCSQEASELCSDEPVLHVSGQLIWSKQEEFPFLMTQRTKFMKGVCRIHTSEGSICAVNAVRYGHNYCKIYVNTDLPVKSKEILRVKMSMRKHTLLSFKFNPYVNIPWSWNEDSTPVVYMGPNVLIPGNCATIVEYTNKYFCIKGIYITAFIVNIPKGDVDFEIETCQWLPASTAQILVKNNSPFPKSLTSGTQLGQAYFILSEKYILADVLPKSLLGKLSTCVVLPGNIHINATKLTKLSKTSCRVNIVDD